MQMHHKARKIWKPCVSFRNIYKSRPFDGRFKTFANLNPLQVVPELIQIWTTCESFRNLCKTRPLSKFIEINLTIEIVTATIIKIIQF